VTWDLAPALVSGAAGLAGGLVMPSLLARLPEPDLDPKPDGAVDGLVPAANEAEFARPVDEPKERYADMAARRGCGPASRSPRCSSPRWSEPGSAGAGRLLFLVYLVPVGVTLAVVDWRTRYLPTRLIAPSYVVVGVLAVVASALSSDWLSLRSAAIGWIGCFAVFFVMCSSGPRAMAYGDVRLAGLLGLAVGWEGVAQVVVGMFTASCCWPWSGRSCRGADLPPQAHAVRAVPAPRRAGGGDLPAGGAERVRRGGQTGVVSLFS
jgi:leader peptidase (prepilin peptidase)/N-methyltransferase